MNMPLVIYILRSLCTVMLYTMYYASVFMKLKMFPKQNVFQKKAIDSVGQQLLAGCQLPPHSQSSPVLFCPLLYSAVRRDLVQLSQVCMAIIGWYIILIIVTLNLSCHPKNNMFVCTLSTVCYKEEHSNMISDTCT